jgi:hypothetical protein
VLILNLICGACLMEIPNTYHPHEDHTFLAVVTLGHIVSSTFALTKS